MTFLRKNIMEKSKKGPNLYGEKENDKIALTHDPYAVAWKMKSKGKLIGKIVGHLPKELSRAACFFLERGGKISGNNFEEKYRPSQIPKEGQKMNSRSKIKKEKFLKGFRILLKIIIKIMKTLVITRSMIRECWICSVETLEELQNRKIWTRKRRLPSWWWRRRRSLFRLSVSDITWKDYKEKDQCFTFLIFAPLLENL